MPVISVLMTYYNENIKWFRESVESILNQTFQDFEFIIIIDNPILDLEIQDYIMKLSKNKQIIILKNKQNLGLANSLNKGLEISNGIYIARMDADDISDVNRLEKEVSYIESNNFDMVFSNKNIINEDTQLIRKGDVFRFDSQNINKVLDIYNCVVHPSVLIKKKVLVNLNGYRDFPQAQDYDLWLRLVDNKYKIGVINECLINYRIRESSISNKKALRQYLTSMYQKKLHKQRQKNNCDNFSVGELEKYLAKHYADNDLNCSKFINGCELLNCGIKMLMKGEKKGLFMLVKGLFIHKIVVFKLLDTIKYRMQISINNTLL